jgi:phenolic acid decarboxylase
MTTFASQMIHTLYDDLCDKMLFIRNHHTVHARIGQGRIVDDQVVFVAFLLIV